MSPRRYHGTPEPVAFAIAGITLAIIGGLAFIAYVVLPLWERF